MLGIKVVKKERLQSLIYKNLWVTYIWKEEGEGWGREGEEMKTGMKREANVKANLFISPKNNIEWHWIELNYKRISTVWLRTNSWVHWRLVWEPSWVMCMKRNHYHQPDFNELDCEELSTVEKGHLYRKSGRC